MGCNTEEEFCHGSLIATLGLMLSNSSNESQNGNVSGEPDCVINQRQPHFDEEIVYTLIDMKTCCCHRNSAEVLVEILTVVKNIPCRLINPY